MYEDLVGSYKSSLNQLKDLGDLYELALEENNTTIQNEILESIKNLRKLAKKNLPAPIFHYIDGAADDEVTYARNTSAFDDCDLIPNILNNVGDKYIITGWYSFNDNK